MPTVALASTSTEICSAAVTVGAALLEADTLPETAGTNSDDEKAKVVAADVWTMSAATRTIGSVRGSAPPRRRASRETCKQRCQTCKYAFDTQRSTLWLARGAIAWLFLGPRRVPERLPL